MSNSGNRISGFTRQPPRKARTCAKSLAIDLSDSACQRAGEIFGVLKAEASAKNCDALSAHIEDALVRGVFEALRKLPKNSTQEAILEAAVGKVNDALFRLLGDDGLSLGPDTISGAVISQKGKDVCAAVWGQPSILLFHPASNGQIHIYDLVDDGSGAPEQRGRGFSQIISGRITGQDRLLVASDDLRNPLGDEQLADVVLRDNPDIAIESLKQALSSARLGFSISVFVSDGVYVPAEQEAAEGQPRRSLKASIQGASPRSGQSMERLNTTANETSEIMSPPLLPSLSKRIGGGLKSAFGWLPGKISEWKEGKHQEEVIANGTGGDFHTVARTVEAANAQKKLNSASEAPETEKEGGLEAEWEAWEDSQSTALESQYDPMEDDVALSESDPLADLGEEALPAPSHTVTAPMAPAAPKRKRLGFRESIHLGLVTFIDSINSLPKLGKGAVIMVLFSLSVLNVSSIYLSWEQAQKELAEAQEKAVAAIEERLDSAEASLIYRDDRRAQDLLDEAEVLISVMPEVTDIEKIDKRAMEIELEQHRKTANRAVDLNSPEVVASLNGADGPARLKNLALLKDKIYAASDSGSIYVIDPQGGAAPAEAATDEQPAVFLADADRDRLLTATADGKLLAVSADGEANESALNWSDINAKDAVVWGLRLYVLDPAHNRLVRHYASGEGYGSPQFYLKDDTDVSAGRSMAVDGSLWILSGGHEVLKVQKGKRQEFQIESVRPALTDARRIRTSENDENVWLLDPTGRRLLAFDKDTGVLDQQYLSDKLAGTDDFLVDEVSRTVVTAKGNSVLRFTLP